MPDIVSFLNFCLHLWWFEQWSLGIWVRLHLVCFYLPERLKNVVFYPGPAQSPQWRHLERFFLALSQEKGFPDNAKFSLSFTKTPDICQRFSPWSKIASAVEKQECSLLWVMFFFLRQNYKLRNKDAFALSLLLPSARLYIFQKIIQRVKSKMA